MEKIKFRSEESRKLAAQLHFTEPQAKAILEMRLQKLIGLEIEALIKEHEMTLANIELYRRILDDRKTMMGVIIRELEQWKKKYAAERRTVIENGREAVFEEKKIEEKEVIFLMDRFGYAKTVDVSVYERNKEAADSENRVIFPCRNTGRIGVFTDTGRLHTIKVPDLPYGKFRDKGTPIDNVCNYDSTTENIVYIQDMEHICSSELLFTTKKSMMKFVDGAEMDVSKRTVAATKLADDDKLLSIDLVDSRERHVVLQTRQGVFLRFVLEEVPVKKKGAVGVRGMKLADKDEVEAVYILTEDGPQIVNSGKKEVHLNRLKVSGRDTKGTKNR